MKFYPVSRYLVSTLVRERDVGLYPVLSTIRFWSMVLIDLMDLKM